MLPTSADPQSQLSASQLVAVKNYPIVYGLGSFGLESLYKVFVVFYMFYYIDQLGLVVAMAELLRLAISQNIAPGYASTLLSAFPKYILGAVPIAKELTVDTEMLVEPLSEREIEVLRLMAKGYKYKEIAEKLVVSINTIRHHTRNFYSKLNANNRTQAIGRAKELNIL